MTIPYAFTASWSSEKKNQCRNYMYAVNDMQTLEAIFSLMFFLSISTVVLLEAEPKPVDDSLYRMELANDAWRVLYLRGAFEDFGESKRDFIEDEMTGMGEITGLCYFIEGINYTNCRSGGRHEKTASLEKTLLYNKTLRVVTFSVQK
jgi:hypothetical protein